MFGTAGASGLIQSVVLNVVWVAMIVVAVFGVGCVWVWLRGRSSKR